MNEESDLRTQPMSAGSTLAVLTSGGDAPGMNVAIRTVTKIALARGFRVLGIRHGYKGLLDGDTVELQHRDVDQIVRFGGTLLGSARELRFKTVEGRELAQRRVTELGIDGVVVVGGDGSLTGARVLAGLTASDGARLRVVGIPASIDNDVGCSSLAIGVDTAMNTIVSAIDKIADTARAHERTFVVEVMGRDCGYLAMVSGIASSADVVLYRERGLSHEEILAQVEAAARRAYSGGSGKRMVLIVKAEGVTLPASAIKEHLDAHLRPEMPALETRVTVLGHLVRGGAPSAMDRLVAARLANTAVLAAADGHTDVMAAWRPPTGERSAWDPDVALFSLEVVLRETAAIRDGTSAVSRKRVALLSGVEDVLSL
jgi:6-phosphofructokinase 1